MYNKPLLKSINQLIDGLKVHKEVIVGTNTLTLRNDQVVRRVMTKDLKLQYIPFNDLSSLLGCIYVWIK